MIGYSLVGKLRQFLSWLYYGHQWARWEILTIGIVVLGVLLLIVRQLRKRTIRRVYASQLPGQSPVIGVNLGSRRHGIKDLKKMRRASVPERREKQTKSKKTTESSEKLHEQIKQLQLEIIKRKQTETRLEQHVANLTAGKEQLQRELSESRQVEEHPIQEVAGVPAADEKLQPEVAEEKQAEQDFKEEVVEVPVADEKLQPEVAEEKQVEQDFKEEVVEVPVADEKLQPEVAEKEQAEQGLKEQAAEEPAEKKPPKKKPVGSGSKYEDFHRVVDGVKQKLCRKCNEWKPESEFHKNASCKDGLAASCKVCKAKAARQYRERRKAEKNNGQ
jgi:hypothetical protein